MFHVRIRQLTSTMTILALLLAIIGFPLPPQVPDSDEDFPCKDHGCGCTNALMCKTACCCAPPAPKLSLKTQAPTGGCCSTKSPKKTATPKSGWVFQSQSCQGIAVIWTAMGIIAPPTAESCDLILTRHVVCQIPADDRLGPITPLTLEPPPPRSLLS
ncbi:MAG: hypothetical protein R3E58_12375 [Phycisphaerae bacterium]